jgi:predicted amidohydrolase
MIIAPSGQIIAQAITTGDELISAEIDLDYCRFYKDTLFDFDRYRVPEAYRLITERRGAKPQEEPS